ncbi:ABC transporter substrate-binding protein [Pseudonocardia lacus]|uniref:ABC transporter substrate-binding protein n=1 Tax=Pseudonocardia lacus TaxID=2835865 RepID=UPI001BDC87CC|nr:extracellular solute-binding protein [Pseudonocardia lacus]
MRFRKRATHVVATAGLIVLTACSPGSSGESAPAGPVSTADSGPASAVTPISDEIIAAAEQEGSVLLYSNANPEVFQPLADGFAAKYPNIEVRNLDLDDTQIVERYKSETATGAPTADLVMGSSQLTLSAFVDDGHILDYQDPNLENLPEAAELAPGMTAISLDPVVGVFNTALLPKDRQPRSVADYVALAATDSGKIGTVAVSNSFAYHVVASYLKHTGEQGWANLEAIGRSAGVENGSANIAQKLLQGQYAASLFQSGAIRPLLVGDAAKVLNYDYVTDGTVLVPRAIGITARAPHPNAAKVFLNYALSVEGQNEACKGGFSPYRAGVTCPYGLTAVEEAVGAENVINDGWDPSFVSDHDAIVTRWNRAFGR